MSDRGVPDRIISGGQTGADRAALDVAIQLNIPHGGWCPRGRRAEDGPLDERYQLRETASRNYAVRTERNVVASDATLIVSALPLSGGTKLTRDLAERHGKPLLVIDTAAPTLENAAAIRQWITTQALSTVNVAGPRESTQHGIYDAVLKVLQIAWGGEFGGCSSRE